MGETEICRVLYWQSIDLCNFFHCFFSNQMKFRRHYLLLHPYISLNFYCYLCFGSGFSLLSEWKICPRVYVESFYSRTHSRGLGGLKNGSGNERVDFGSRTRKHVREVNERTLLRVPLSMILERERFSWLNHTKTKAAKLGLSWRWIYLWGSLT